MLVLECYLTDFCILDCCVWFYDEDVCRCSHALLHGKKFLSVVGRSHRNEVGLFVSQLLYFAVKVGLVDVNATVPYCQERESFRVGIPEIRVHVSVKRLGHILLLACLDGIDAKSVAVSLIAVASHALPCYVLSVGRELRVCVVTRIVLEVFLAVYCLILHCLCRVNLWCHIVGWLAKISGLLCVDVIEIDVRIGRNGIIYTRFLATGICYLL